MKGLSDFLRVVEARELDMFQDDLLFREWNTRKEDGGPLVANALENWTDIDWFAYRYLSQGNDDVVDKHVKAFIEADPIRGSIVRMKEDDAVAYEAELQQLKDDKSGYGSSSESKGIAGKLLRYRTGISSMTAAFLPSKHTYACSGKCCCSWCTLNRKTDGGYPQSSSSPISSWILSCPCFSSMTFGSNASTSSSGDHDYSLIFLTHLDLGSFQLLIY